MNVRKRAEFRRQWRLVFALHGKRRGLSVLQLASELSASRATIYRDIALLQAAGCPVQTETVNGEARYKLSDTTLPALQITAKQLAALLLARSALSTLEGTSLLRELDALFESNRLGTFEPSSSVSLARSRAPWTRHLNQLENAIEHGRRVLLRYRGTRDAEPRTRRIDPLRIRVVEGHVYLIAFDLSAHALRTFKLARITAIQKFPGERAAKYPDFDEAALFRHAAKIWSGPSVDVVIRLSATSKRFVHEYPLRPDQRLTDEPDGSLLVHATVAGTTEAMRWVLSWGKEAEAVAPAELREAVRGELAGGLVRYQAAAGPRRGQNRKPLKRVVSRDRETGVG